MSDAGVRQGPIVQSVSLGLRALTGVTLLLAALWLGSGVRRVPADSTAVVFRFGAVDRVQGAGLLLAWPAPFETVSLVDGPARQTSQVVAALPRSPGLDDVYTRAAGVPLQGAAGVFLTGDGDAVLLDATLTWHIADSAAFVLASTHVAAALDRMFRAAAIRVAAGHPVDDFLVVQTGSAKPGRDTQAMAAIRQQVRDALLEGVNARLAALEAVGAPLGVRVDRIDLTAALPPKAKLAYDGLLVAEQAADQGVANARTAALRTGQTATQEMRRVLDMARAAAAERVSAATSEVSPVLALEAEGARPARAGLLIDAYRSRAATILRRAGHVTAVDPAGGNRLILPAGQP